MAVDGEISDGKCLGGFEVCFREGEYVYAIGFKKVCDEVSPRAITIDVRGT